MKGWMPSADEHLSGLNGYDWEDPPSIGYGVGMAGEMALMTYPSAG